ncbi:MAG: glutathione S-transferase family protein [Deltaproteobacteria bacterium]|nr:glutathione S-transferase family protein [Deltaproteobacteria bacterium]
MLTVTTYDWVPPPPRGFVRDLRVRWALEEAKLPYRVATVPFVPFKERGAEHLAHQPFGQVPWLTDGDTTVFESGAILLHIAKKTGTDTSDVIEWVFAALNSVEMPVVPWTIFKFSKLDGEAVSQVDNFLDLRLQRMEPVLAAREWLTGAFTVADILMADVLRIVDRFDGLAKYPACKAYLARATARPAFAKAHGDQLAHFAAGDAKRS